METTFILGRINHCPECNWKKIVFQEGGVETGRTNLGNKVALFGLWLRRVSERLQGGRDERRETTRKRLISTTVLWLVIFVIEKLESLPRAAALFAVSISAFGVPFQSRNENQETSKTLAASRIACVANS